MFSRCSGLGNGRLCSHVRLTHPQCAASTTARADALAQPKTTKHLNEYLKTKVKSRRNVLPEITASDLKPLYYDRGGLMDKKVYDLSDEEFQLKKKTFKNRGARFGYGARKYEYEHMKRSLMAVPSAIEKLHLINPHERPWVTSERRHWQPFQPALVATRKAYHLPVAPTGYDSLGFYQHVTRTKVLSDWPEHYFDDVQPAADAENQLKRLLQEHITLEDHLVEHDIEHDTPAHRQQYYANVVARLASTVLDHVLLNHSSCSHIDDAAISRACKLHAFWVRGGFQALYYKHTDLSWKYVPRVQGDTRTRRGELAFYVRETPAGMLRTHMPLPPVTQDSEDMHYPIARDMTTYWPKTYRIRADDSPLEMCAGYELSTAEHCEFAHTVFVDLHAVNDKVTRWHLGEPNEDNQHTEAVTAAALSTGFAAAVAQAHALGFNQYNDLTYPLVTQVVITNGRYWYLALYQLNSLNLAHDWPEVQTIDHVNGLFSTRPAADELSRLEDTRVKHNLCWLKGPLPLFDVHDGRSHNWDKQGITRSLLQMLLRPTATYDNDVLRPYIDSSWPQNQQYHFEEPAWGSHWYEWIRCGLNPRDRLEYVSETNPRIEYGKRRFK